MMPENGSRLFASALRDFLAARGIESLPDYMLVGMMLGAAIGGLLYILIVAGKLILSAVDGR